MNWSKVTRIAAAVLTLALAAALCAAVLTLYAAGQARRARTGSLTAPVFTREDAAVQLRRVSPLAALWLASLVAAAAAGAPAGRRGRPARQARLRMRGQEETPRRRALRAALYAAAVALLAAGILNGGLNDVLVKAVNICTECIGLG